MAESKSKKPRPPRAVRAKFTRFVPPDQENVIVGRGSDGGTIVVTPERFNVGRRLEVIQGLSMLRICMSTDHPLRDKVGALLEEIADETAAEALAVFTKAHSRRVGKRA